MKLVVLPDRLAICKLRHDAAVPAWAWDSAFVSVTRTADELSIVCAEASLPDQSLPDHLEAVERGWRALRVAGTLDFALVGILARLSAPLARAGVSIFAISTFDTDYLLVRASDLDTAIAALRSAGHEIVTQGPPR